MTDVYNNDNTLRETIRSFIETQLNTAAKPSSEQLVDFVLGKDFLQTSDDITQVKTITGTFRTVNEEFTIGMITDFLGTFEPLKNLKLITYTLPMVFLVSTKVKYDEIKESLERFVDLLIGSDFEENGYVFATNCTEMTNTEQVTDINGIEYVKMTTNVFITSTVKALLGNKIETYLGPVDENGDFDETKLIRIYPTDRSTSRAFIPEETHKNEEKESTTIFKESTWTANLSFVIKKDEEGESFYQDLIIQLEDPTLLNKTWSYRIVYGDIVANPFDKVVSFQGITLDGEIGNFALASLILKKSGING